MTPPRKKPNRVHPWRDEYVRELGVRVIDRDTSTWEVLTVECRFCAAFGREERVLEATKKEERVTDGSSNDDGGSSGRGPNGTTADADMTNNNSNDTNASGAEPPRKRKRRARTRSIAQWKTSFRSDNMRSHHVEQHPLKWGEYQQLLALAKKEQAMQGLPVRQPYSQGQASETNGGDELVYTQQLRAFFGDAAANEEAPPVQVVLVAPSSQVKQLTPKKRRERKVSLNKTITASSSSHHHQKRQRNQDNDVLLPATDSSTPPAEVLVLTEITSPTIVDEVVSSLIDTEREVVADRSEDGADSGNGSEPQSSSPRNLSSTPAMLQPIYSIERTTGTHVVDTAIPGQTASPAHLPVTKYSIALESVSEFSYVRQLLAMETSVTFAQIASIVAISRAQFNLGSRLSRVSQASVREYAKLVVAADLQMITDMLGASWAYSLALQGSERSERENGFKRISVDVRVRFPSAGGTSVEDFHLVTVTSPPFKSAAAGPECSPSDVSLAIAELIAKTLAALDPLWQKKLVGACDEASARTMDVVASVLDRIEEMAEAAGPFYRVYRGAQIVEASLLSALDGSLSCSNTVGSEDQAHTFIEQLDATVQYLCSQHQWSKTHGMCPKPSVTTSPWSLLETLQWVVTRREQIGQLQSENEPSLPPAARLSSEWWVVCLGLTDVLSDYYSIDNTLTNKTQQQRPHAAREALSQFVKDQALKLGVSRIEDADQVDHFQADDTLLRLKRFLWPKDNIVAFFRSLNLSTRRLYSQLSHQEQASAIHQVGAFVLQSLDAVTLMISEGASTKETKTSQSDSDPGRRAVVDAADVEIERLLPTRPLDFVAIERGAVVDFIEHHSARLELSFDLAFIDAVSKQIKDLHVLVAGEATLKAKLVAAQGKSFLEAWEPVKTYSFVRSLAAGFATAVPRSITSFESQSIVLPGRCMSNAVRLASLQVEAHAHALQSDAIEASYTSFKLGQGSTMPDAVEL